MDFGKALRHVMYRRFQGSKKITSRHNARYIFNIYTDADFSDREFRALVAEEPKIITCTKGYYILPKKDKRGVEASIARWHLKESHSKAMAILQRHAKQLSAVKRMELGKVLL